MGEQFSGAPPTSVSYSVPLEGVAASPALIEALPYSVSCLLDHCDQGAIRGPLVLLLCSLFPLLYPSQRSTSPAWEGG